MSERKRGFEPINLLFGLMMGTADIIPGVSGGTVALIVGIYERLIASVRALAAGVVNLLRRRSAVARISFREVEWGLVLPLGTGIVTALFLGARILRPLLLAYPVQFSALFFGLIAASVPVPWHRIHDRLPKHYVITGVATVTAFVIVGLPPRELLDPSLPIVFLAAAVAICAMILPGVSGAFLLVVMGLYQATIVALNDFSIGYIGVFILGAAIGLGTFSKLLDYLLSTHHDATMAALVGLMIGSLRALWPYQDESRAFLRPPSLESFLLATALGLLGFLIVTALIRLGDAIAERERARGPGEVDTRKGPL